jgi:hypothetical protein
MNYKYITATGTSPEDTFDDVIRELRSMGIDLNLSEYNIINPKEKALKARIKKLSRKTTKKKTSKDNIDPTSKLGLILI